MAARYQTFALKVPSGRWVEVRHPSAAATVGRGVLLTPLLTAAVRSQAEEGEEEPERPDPLVVLRDFCAAVMVRPAIPEEVRWDEVPFADLYAVYVWAATGHGEARPLREVAWRHQDFMPLVGGNSAIHLDLMCNRYGVRPSIALGVAEAACALDLDMAVSYRGLKRESDGASGDVVVEDALGGKHKVPRKWLPLGNVEAGAEPVSLEARVRGTGGGVFSAGGMYGDGKIDFMPRPGSADRAGG